MNRHNYLSQYTWKDDSMTAGCTHCNDGSVLESYASVYEQVLVDQAQHTIFAAT
jgi:hypothetical protein